MRLVMGLPAGLLLAGLPAIAVAAPAPFCSSEGGAIAPSPIGPITFLSKTNRAYSYLEGLQDLAFADNPRIHRWTGSAEDQAQLRQVVDQLDKRGKGDSANPYGAIYDSVIAQLQRAMPTQYENPGSMAILCSVALTVQAEIVRDRPGFELPYLGTLPSGTLNAQSFLVPDSGEELIAVNFSLFTFVHEFGKIGLATIRIGEEGDKVAISTSDDYFNSIRTDPAFLTRASMALEDFANQRPIRGHAPPRALDDPLLAAMDAALEEFVIAHEFAHIVLHHTSRDTDPPSDLGATRSISDEELRRRWGEEAIADLYAAALTQRISANRYRAASAESLNSELGEFVRYAPVLFFQLNQIAEEARYVHDHVAPAPKFSAQDRATVLKFLGDALGDQAGALDGKHPKSASPASSQSVPAIVRQFGDHPPAWARRALVATYWKDRAPAPKSDTEIAFGTVAIAMGNNLENLWGDIEPLWIQIIKKGRKS